MTPAHVPAPHIVTHDPDWSACTCTCGYIHIHTSSRFLCARIAQDHLAATRKETPPWVKNVTPKSSSAATVTQT